MSNIPSPQNDKRACLCKDGKSYSKKCCDGTLEAQGIGSTVKIDTISYYTVTSCVSGTQNIRVLGRSLTVGGKYYLNFVHNQLSGCYTITATRNNGDERINNETSYLNCNACIAAN